MRPKSVQASKSRAELFIEWEDGHESRYPLAGLRAACPCAECRGGHEGMGQPVTPDLMRSRVVEGPAAELVSLEAVGNYALLLVWADGHRYGIYSWDMLRRLCPCERHGGGA
jgi:DUF971 family protein